MADDVVAELDEWLSVTRKRPDEQWLTSRWMVERARDEIVELRSTAERRLSMVQHANRCIEEAQALLVAVRDEALEEAARVCERRRDETGLQEAYAVLDVESYTSACGGCAYDIRALKEGRGE